MNDAEFSPIWLFVLIPLSFVIAFPLFWLFVVGMIGQFGSWQRLAQCYRAQPSTPSLVAGKLWPRQYGYVNGARYGNALDVTTNDMGMFIATMWLFRFNHPPLFIPWHDLHNPKPIVRRQRDFIQVEIGHPPIATLSLPPAIFAARIKD